jgi:superoxide dismutase, Fe-Mn family
MKNLDKIIREAIDSTLSENGLNNDSNSNTLNKELVSETYVVEAGKFKLQTELLSSKTKKAHLDLLDEYTKKLNLISSQLDGVDKSSSNLNSSSFRSLKIDETYNHNAVFLHGLYFENISDLNSTITMDSLSYIRLARDFGTFDSWQEDFLACCLSARNGWAVTYYDLHLKRFVNTFIDLHSQNVMIGMFPVIAMDCWEHSYYKDYLKDRKSYIFGMMKELNWTIIENRIKKADRISNVL